MRLTAKQCRERIFAEQRQQRELKEQQCREAIIAEFSGNMNALADEILRYRRCIAQLADAVDWTKTGMPFITLGPGGGSNHHASSQ
jgi:hypothetical protein